MQKRILTVLGARPQFIKASVVSHAITQHNVLTEVIVHTGQHYDNNMSDIFFSELGIPQPDYHLGVGGGHHGHMTGRMLGAIEKVLMEVQPDAVLVYGDTNSTLAGALAAAKLHIPVAHVEAGLRSFNMQMPEEINRILTDRISNWLFAPTDIAVSHLLREGCHSEQVINVGDVMYDVALHHGARVTVEGRKLTDLNLYPENYVLATIHRAENTDNIDRLTAIVSGLQAVSEQIPVVWPIHPRTLNVMKEKGLLPVTSGNLHLIEPVGYLDMVQLEKYAAVIATDSGGVQKEAFFYQVPCVTLRDETEWVELVDSGWNHLLPPISSGEIAQTILSAIGSQGLGIQPYGNGNAADLIVARLMNGLELGYASQ